MTRAMTAATPSGSRRRRACDPEATRDEAGTDRRALVAPALVRPSDIRDDGTPLGRAARPEVDRPAPLLPAGLPTAVVGFDVERVEVLRVDVVRRDVGCCAEARACECDRVVLPAEPRDRGRSVTRETPMTTRHRHRDRQQPRRDPLRCATTGCTWPPDPNGPAHRS